MARKGTKVVVIDVSDPSDIEQISEFIKRKNKGLRYDFSYAHDAGLQITLYGPDDTIQLVERELLLFVEELKNDK